MRLLKTHSHTSERPGYQARKNAKKTNWRKRRRYNKANHPSKTCRVPPVWRGGRDERGAMAYRQRGEGGETKKGELKENTGAKAYANGNGILNFLNVRF